jgi:hypothetical protein
MPLSWPIAPGTPLRDRQLLRLNWVAADDACRRDILDRLLTAVDHEIEDLAAAGPCSASRLTLLTLDPNGLARG